MVMQQDSERAWMYGAHLLEGQLSGIETSIAMPSAAQAVPFIFELIEGQTDPLRRTRLWHLLTRLCGVLLLRQTADAVSSFERGDPARPGDPVSAVGAHSPRIISALRGATDLEAIAVAALIGHWLPEVASAAVPALWDQACRGARAASAALMTLATCENERGRVADAAAVFLDDESSNQARVYAALAQTTAVDGVDRRAIEVLAAARQPAEVLACGFSAPLRMSLPTLVGKNLRRPDRLEALLRTAPLIINDATLTISEIADTIEVLHAAVRLPPGADPAWSEQGRAVLRLIAHAPAWTLAPAEFGRVLGLRGLPEDPRALMQALAT